MSASAATRPERGRTEVFWSPRARRSVIGARHCVGQYGSRDGIGAADPRLEEGSPCDPTDRVKFPTALEYRQLTPASFSEPASYCVISGIWVSQVLKRIDAMNHLRVRRWFIASDSRTEWWTSTKSTARLGERPLGIFDRAEFGL